MKTIQTKPDCTLGFVKWDWHPAPVKVLVEGEEKPRSLTYEGKPVIGKLSEITEEQAKELVELSIGYIGAYNSGGDGYKAMFEKPTFALNSFAKSAGIKEEEFDKYLVIKL